MPSKSSLLISRDEIKRLLSGSAFLFMCRIGGAALTFLTQLLLARWMGAAEFGSYILAFSWLTLMSAIPSAGYTAAAVRFIGEGLAKDKHGIARGYIKNATRVTILSSIGIAILAIGCIALFPGFPEELQILFLVTFAAVPLFAIMRINNGIAMAMSRFAQGYLPGNIFRPSLFLLVVWVIWSQGASLTADLAMELHFGVLILLAILTTITRRLTMREMLSQAPLVSDANNWNNAAMPLLGVSLFTSYFPQITVIVSGFFLSSIDIGIYNVGYRVAMLISFTLVAFDAFTAPTLSRYYHKDDRTKLITEIQHSTTLRFGIAMGAVVFLTFFGDWVLGLFGPEFKEGYQLTLLLALSQLSHAAVGPVTKLLAITGHQKQSMYASSASLIVWLALAAILMPLYGVLGVAIAVFVALTTWAFILRQMVVKYMGVSILITVRDLETSPQMHK